MFWFLTIIGVCEIALIIPIIYTLIGVFYYPNTAFLFSCILVILPVIGGLLNKSIKKAYIYRLITIPIAILIGFVVIALFNSEAMRLPIVGSILVSILCFAALELSKYNFETNADTSDVFAFAALLINIPLALWNNINNSNISWQLNLFIAVSTIISTVVLILKQVDSSRRFGQNTMTITKTQRKNNKILATVFVAFVILAGSFGQWSVIYSAIGNIIKWFFKIISSLFPKPSAIKSEQQPQNMEMLQLDAENKPDSILDIIIQYAFKIIAILAVLACLAFLSYKLFKFIKWLVTNLIAWLKGREYTYSYAENGHIDEKESLLKRNISKTASKLNDMVKSFFEREIPYSHLTDDVSRMRRLYQLYLKNVAKSKGNNNSTAVNKNLFNFSQDNVTAENAFSSLTSGEICELAKKTVPADADFHCFIAQCYDLARYSATAPSKKDITIIEAKIKP